MVPFVVLVASSILLRIAGVLGVRSLKSWVVCVRWGLAILFAFAGSTHFSRMRHEYAAMIPPPIPPILGIVYLTGLAEMAGALGLLIPRFRRLAAICLVVLLIALFPANVHAALAGIPFGGRPPTPLLPRALLQLVFIGALWWSSIQGQASPTKT